MNALKQFERDLNDQSRAIKSMLPPGIDQRRFMRTVCNSVKIHPQSDRLLAADRQSLFAACQKAAGDGLLPDGREATLVVFHENKTNMDKVTYMPMVQGLVKLARNSGEISNIVAEVVYENDGFEYSPGIHEQPLHKPEWFGDRGRPIGAYAVVTTREGERIVRVLPRDRIIAIGKGGHNADQYVPGKGAHFEEWWRKTMIKNVLKYSPKSTCLESAMDADNDLVDFDSIPVTEKDISPLQKALKQQGEPVTARTDSDSPSARLGTHRPDSEELAGTENTPEKTNKDYSESIDTAQEQVGRVSKLLHDNSQVPYAKPNDEDRKLLKMALDSIASCSSVKQLEECGKDLEGYLHVELAGEARAAYRKRMDELG